MMHSFSFEVGLLAFSLLRLALGGKNCYFPNSDPSGGDVPCDPSASDSVCCGRGWTCLSNGACEFNLDSIDPQIGNSIGELWRGSCTDSSWKSAQCPQFCYGEFRYNNVATPRSMFPVYGICPPHRRQTTRGIPCSSWENIQLTDVQSESWSSWTHGGPQLIRSCGQENYCCQESGKNTSCCLKEQYFKLPQVKAEQVLIPLSGDVSSSAAPSTSAQPTSTNDVQPLAVETTLSPTTTYSTSSSSTLLRAPVSPTASPVASTNSATKDSPTNKGLAAGLGVTLGLAAIGGVLFGLFKYNQRRRRRLVEKLQSYRMGTPDVGPTLLPQHPIETNGYTEWEMATNINAHEAPSESESSQNQAPRRTRRSRLGF